jgi:hypothetical protein
VTYHLTLADFREAVERLSAEGRGEIVVEIARRDVIFR